MVAKRKKRPRGRPPKQAGQRKTESLLVRLDPTEKQAFQDAAEFAGVPVSIWVRERLRLAARRELIEAGKRIPFLMPPTEK